VLLKTVVVMEGILQRQIQPQGCAEASATGKPMRPRSSSSKSRSSKLAAAPTCQGIVMLITGQKQQQKTRQSMCQVLKMARLLLHLLLLAVRAVEVVGADHTGAAARESRGQLAKGPAAAALPLLPLQLQIPVAGILWCSAAGILCLMSSRLHCMT
jgi:hypothetical protein